MSPPVDFSAPVDDNAIEVVEMRGGAKNQKLRLIGLNDDSSWGSTAETKRLPNPERICTVIVELVPSVMDMLFVIVVGV